MISTVYFKFSLRVQFSDSKVYSYKCSNDAYHVIDSCWRKLMHNAAELTYQPGAKYSSEDNHTLHIYALPDATE